MQPLRTIENFIEMLSLWFRGMKKDQRPPNVSWYEYARAKNEWLIEHTDPLFGRPIDFDGVLYFENARRKWDLSLIPNEYQPAFRYSPSGKVRVFTDEFPLVDQKYIFEWIVDYMDKITERMPGLLLASSSDCLNGTDPALAFRPDKIYKIILTGSRPVGWTILFDTEIGEGEAFVGKIIGKDQQIERAELHL